MRIKKQHNVVADLSLFHALYGLKLRLNLCQLIFSLRLGLGFSICGGNGFVPLRVYSTIMLLFQRASFDLRWCQYAVQE
jgi:hypothetical protein